MSKIKDKIPTFDDMLPIMRSMYGKVAKPVINREKVNYEEPIDLDKMRKESEERRKQKHFQDLVKGAL